jgi:hypothetical protein
MMAGIPQLPYSGDRMLGGKLATALALYTALKGLEQFEELDPLTLDMLEESIITYAHALNFEAEA